jgi:hypothetical protein
MNVNEALLDKLLSHSCHAQQYQIIFFLLNRIYPCPSF